MELVSLVSGMGEPTLYPDFFEALSILKGVSDRIKIFSNGATHNEKWWSRLATELRPNDFVIFPLDGLEDTYNIYRVGLSFKKLLKNISAFTGSGGIAECNSLMFEHNKHQREEIRELAGQIGCSRFFGKLSWYYTEEFPQPADASDLIPAYDCLHLVRKEVILDSDGRIWPCCYLPIRETIDDTSMNQDFILRIKYEQSKDKMFTIEDALQTPLYIYVMENMLKLDICSLVCRSNVFQEGQAC